jgi:hypothetical protein
LPSTGIRGLCLSQGLGDHELIGWRPAERSSEFSSLRLNIAVQLVTGLMRPAVIACWASARMSGSSGLLVKVTCANEAASGGSYAGGRVRCSRAVAVLARGAQATVPRSASKARLRKGPVSLTGRLGAHRRPCARRRPVRRGGRVTDTAFS